MMSSPHFGTRRAFTIIELLAGILFISLVLVAVLGMIRAATGHINKIRLETIAINLAREGAEAVYARRNSNWLKRPDKKDAYRICTDYHDNNDCSFFFQPRQDIASGSGPLLWKLDYKSVKDNNNVEVTKDPIFTPIIHNSSQPLPNTIEIPNIAGGKFYRYITVQGLYRKDIAGQGQVHGLPLDACGVQYSVLHDQNSNVNSIIIVGSSTAFNDLKYSYQDGATSKTVACADNSPKELIFCSVVEYEGYGTTKGKVELCSSITNYMK